MSLNNSLIIKLRESSLTVNVDMVYIVPFLTYSMSNNGMQLKSELGSLTVIDGSYTTSYISI